MLYSVVCPEDDREWNSMVYQVVWWFGKNLLGSAFVAAVPQDGRHVFGNISSPPSLTAIFWADTLSLRCSRHAKVAHRRHRVLPVPVGLSRTPFTFWNERQTLVSSFDRDMKWWHFLAYSTTNKSNAVLKVSPTLTQRLWIFGLEHILLQKQFNQVINMACTALQYI